MLPFSSLPWFELARFRRDRLSRAALVAVAIVPLFYGVLYVWANWNPTGNLDRVHAAVVNLDQPVTTTSTDGKKQTVPLGRVLAGELTKNDTKQNFDWVLTDAADAQAGLAHGDYATVVTIPKNFSAAATSSGRSSTDDDVTPAQALLRVRTNDARNYLTGTIARTVGSATTTALNTQVTKTYLDNVYVGFTDLHSQIGKAADGAGDLADGAGKLADGATKTDQGADQLVVGLDQLASATRGLPAQAAQLNRGAQQVSTGADQVSGGLSTLDAGVTRVERGTRNLPAQTRQLAAGVKKLDAAATDLGRGVDRVADGAGDLSTGANRVADGTTAYAAQVRALSSGCAASGAAPAYCTQLAQVAAGAKPLVAGADQIAAGATRLKTGANRVQAGADQFGAGADTLRKGTNRLAAAAPQLVTGLKQAATGVHRLNAGAADLADGADRLADGTAALASAAPKLTQGIAAADSGARQLATGTGQVATGAKKLDSGSATLANSLTEGAEQIPSYTAGQRQALSTAAANPVLNDIQRVNAVQNNGTGLAPYFMALALWVGAMAVFMLLRSLSARALASTASSWRVALAGYLPGAVMVTVQAVLLVAVLHFVVGVQPARLPVLAGFAVLVGLTFAAINQALIATFGGAGRFLALIFVSLQLTSAGGTYPIETAPAFFRALHDLLPMTYAVQGLRAAVAGGSGIGPDLVPLLLWLVLGLAVTVLAAARRRTWSIARLHATAVV
jgi:putative membrane protein